MATDCERRHEQGCSAADQQKMGAKGIEMKQGSLLRHLRTLPFQQMTPADADPVEDANNGIHGKVGLMRKKGGLDDRQIKIAVGFAPTLGVAPPARHEAVENLKEQGKEKSQCHECAGNFGHGVESPTDQQEQQRG